MRIDSHQHFWKYNPAEYGWIGNGMEILKRDFLPHDLAEQLTLNRFAGSVVVQARQSIEETEWLLDLAEKYSFIKAVVGWVDLCSPDIENQLSYFSKNDKLAGVRHVIHDEPDDDFMLRPDFVNGISLLEKYGLTYDLLLFPRHLPNAVKLVQLFPKQPFVINHISKPFIKAGLIEPWSSQLQLLARFPNVSCKLSGMVTEADWKNWTLATFRPYLDTVTEAFGFDRLMIGSDWPVCLLGGSYAKVVNIVSDYFGKFDKSVQDKISGSNCSRFYRIGNRG